MALMYLHLLATGLCVQVSAFRLLTVSDSEREWRAFENFRKTMKILGVSLLLQIGLQTP